MKRTLILMRHGESPAPSPGEADHQRPLSSRGFAAAVGIGRRLKSDGLAPGVVVSSDATRTRQTWVALEQAFVSDLEPTFCRDLYGGDLLALRAAADNWSDEQSTALALGHNPGWSVAVSELSGGWARLMPGNAAVLSGSGETWARALRQPWELVALLRD
jgi:phosphohistidine phosphatase